MKKRIGLLVKVFLSLVFTLLFFVFITRSYSGEGTYKNSFSKIISNFGGELKGFPVVKEVGNWFYPKFNESQTSSFIRYKLVVVLKYLDNYFKDILTDTQEKILDNNIQNLKKTTVNVSYYNKFKENLKKYLVDNKDILEISLYEEDGEKLIGVKYKKINGYKITKELIEQLKVKNNLLLKHQNSSNLILLSMVKFEGKPFIIVSQTIHQNFFSRILDELEVSDNLFYFKDSKDFVILDNYRAYSYKEEKKEKNASYGFYKTFVQAKDVNLKINLSSVDYSLGVVVNKNSFWGNVLASMVLLLFFSLAFLFLDWVLSRVKVLDRVLVKEKPKNLLTNSTQAEKDEREKELSFSGSVNNRKRSVFDEEEAGAGALSKSSSNSSFDSFEARDVSSSSINSPDSGSLKEREDEREEQTSEEREKQTSRGGGNLNPIYNKNAHRDKSIFLDVEEKEG